MHMRRLMKYDEDMFYDLYCDAHGYLPRGDYFYILDQASPEEIEEERKHLISMIESRKRHSFPSSLQ